MADLYGSQDVTIRNDDGSEVVTITPVVSKKGLDTYVVGGQLNISSDDSPTKYQLKTDFDATGDEVTSAADVTLYTFTGAGVLDFVACSAGVSGYEIALFIDGSEKFRMTMDQLGNGLALSNGTSVPIWAEIANKNFRYVPTEGIGFKTSFAVKAKATGANVTIKHLTMFRELVT